MKIVLFYHSLISDWNHGNAHFLRCLCTSLMKQGHEVVVYEPKNGWRLCTLLLDYGYQDLDEFGDKFPHLTTNFYVPSHFDLPTMLRGADLVIVHEWKDHGLVRAIGEYRLVLDFTLFFHDTHHRAI